MNKLCDLVMSIKNGEGDFSKIVSKFRPLVNKYAYKLFYIEIEDSCAEFNLALWEAIMKLEYCENDGQVMNYLHNAVINKYMELYRKSKKYCDHVSVNDEIDVNFKDINSEKEIQNFIFYNDIEKNISDYPETSKKIFREILFYNKSDSQIASELKFSRQYINRKRRDLYKIIRLYFERNNDN